MKILDVLEILPPNQKASIGFYIGDVVHYSEIIPATELIQHLKNKTLLDAEVHNCFSGSHPKTNESSICFVTRDKITIEKNEK